MQTKKPFKLVPVLVGNLDEQGEKAYGEFFQSFLRDPHSIFVVSQRSAFVSSYGSCFSL